MLLVVSSLSVYVVSGVSGVAIDESAVFAIAIRELLSREFVSS